MIRVDYFGRVGNNFFQYVMGRLCAAGTRHKMNTEWIRNDFIEAEKIEDSGIVITNGDEAIITDNNCSLVNNVLVLERQSTSECNYRLHGYFQDAKFYNPFRSLIRTYFKIPEYQKNTEDIVIHLRLTDYYWNNETGHNDCVISPKWYLDILRKEHYKKLYIVVEPHVTNRHYLDQFRTLKPIIISGTPRDDFFFLMKFDRIVCSNSTFAWWAAFLSNATKIYLFKKWMGEHRVNRKLVDMEGATVVDGQFIHNKILGAIDWTGYWNKPDSYFLRSK